MLVIRHINSHLSIGELDLAQYAKENEISIKRDIERAGTQYLLKELLKDKDYVLRYTDTNKPFLENRPEHISISHSHDKLVIISNTKQSTGIDIELMRNKVINIQHKFLSDLELTFAKDHVEKLITIWAAKEAIFKAYGKRELEFSKHINILNWEGAEIIGVLKLEDHFQKYQLVAETKGDYKMVYILHEL